MGGGGLFTLEAAATGRLRLGRLGRFLHAQGPLDRRLWLVGGISHGACLSGGPSKGASGSAGRIRTYDQPVNSRLLYQLSYRGTKTSVREWIF